MWESNMKAVQKKIKRGMPIEDLPAYLRHLADALALKSANLPDELADLPEPLAKLELKAKSKNGAWEVRIKAKAEALVSPAQTVAEKDGAQDGAEPSAPKPAIKYKNLKKRMKNDFRDMEAALADQRLPEQKLVSAFLADADLMMSFSGSKYGEEHYTAFRDACRQLSEANAAQNWGAFKSGFALLDQLQHQCHKRYK
jgi:XXXCH domain-containing protein